MIDHIFSGDVLWMLAVTCSGLTRQDCEGQKRQGVGDVDLIGWSCPSSVHLDRKDWTKGRASRCAESADR